ncbi:MAG: hypothetical protein V3T53_15580, partial [Phycisphaerales bacterium]
DPLAESLLSRDFQSGEKITVTRKDDADNLYFESQPIPKDEGEGDGGDDGDSAEPSPDSPTEEPAATA